VFSLVSLTVAAPLPGEPPATNHHPLPRLSQRSAFAVRHYLGRPSAVKAASVAGEKSRATEFGHAVAELERMSPASPAMGFSPGVDGA